MSNCGILKELDHQWRQLLTENPQMRIRDAAAQLCVSEAELLASQMVVEEPRYLVTRLDGEYRNLMRDLKPLGKVMALTRNDAMVHEKIGVYGNVTVHGAMGLALGIIDLRIFFNHFTHAFAVTEESHVGVRTACSSLILRALPYIKFIPPIARIYWHLISWSIVIGPRSKARCWKFPHRMWRTC